MLVGYIFTENFTVGRNKEGKFLLDILESKKKKKMNNKQVFLVFRKILENQTTGEVPC